MLGYTHPRTECLRFNVVFFGVFFTFTVVLVLVTFVVINGLAFKAPLACNDRGYSYPDSPNECLCLGCWTGSQCELVNPNCYINIGSGQPYLFREYWNQINIPDTDIPIDYRMLYEFNLASPMNSELTAGLGGKLNQMIRSLHKKFRNFNPDGKYLVIGTGASQITGALYRVWGEIAEKPIYAFSQTPFYYHLPPRCISAGSYYCRWTQNYTMDVSEISETVIIPNNPTGKIDKPHYNTTRLLEDLVYYWPHLSGLGYNIPTRDPAISEFSLTKLSGHAGIRFGWMFFSDQALARLVSRKLTDDQMHTSTANLYHVLRIITELYGNGNAFFDWTLQILDRRYTQLVAVLSEQSVFTLGSVRGTAYAWLEQSQFSEGEIVDVFSELGATALFGSEFGVPGCVRINMLEAEILFPFVLETIKNAAEKLEGKTRAEIVLEQSE